MIGLGTIINTCGVLIGGVCGLLFGSKIKQRYQDTLMNATGICVLFLGIIGALEKIFTINNETLVSGNTMMIISSLAIGSLIGEFLNIEAHFENFGEWLKRITKNTSDNAFVDGFVTTTLTICIGAMAIVGALQDGLIGDTSTLEAKAVLDAIIVLVMAASKGKGCIFAAISLFIFQGSITLFSSFIEPVMTPLAFDNLSIVGSILIFCVGINLIWEKKIKIANLLPAIVISVICAYII
ncbi:MAG: DUF554 domain-containing protein [Thomasclavelia sp.]|uniref:DUF554 domain-containing protein n=1 Tax=Thomasclavelia sp. TaxID=3025757 RepID=UPI0039A09B42